MKRLATVMFCATAVLVTAAAVLPQLQPTTPNCAGLDLKGCLDQYTDTAWQWSPEEFRDWSIAT